MYFCDVFACCQMVWHSMNIDYADIMITLNHMKSIVKWRTFRADNLLHD